MSRIRLPAPVLRLAMYRTVLATVFLITLVVAITLAALAVYDGRALYEAAYSRLSSTDTGIAVTVQTNSVSTVASDASQIDSYASQYVGGPHGTTQSGALWTAALTVTGEAPPRPGRPRLRRRTSRCRRRPSTT
jgi:hypothetical protein